MVKRITPGPGQESVWDYPRPPAVDPTGKHIQVVFNDVTIADTRRAIRILETSHPPTYYIPTEDIALDYLVRTGHRTFCEFKGQAIYWTLRINDRVSKDAAWSYPNPTSGFGAIRNHLCFYPSRVDACYIDGEQVEAQKGDFYGGWITSDIVGPFKGGPGTQSW